MQVNVNKKKLNKKQKIWKTKYNNNNNNNEPVKRLHKAQHETK